VKPDGGDPPMFITGPSMAEINLRDQSICSSGSMHEMKARESKPFHTRLGGQQP
jgi:hypothetical protein